MNTLNKTECFNRWLDDLRDFTALAKITRRLERAERGNFGDHKHVDGPVWEMRIHYGPGYRLYYVQEGNTIYILLCGGIKATQQSDIKLAKELWRHIHGH